MKRLVAILRLSASILAGAWVSYYVLEGGGMKRAVLFGVGLFISLLICGWVIGRIDKERRALLENADRALGEPLIQGTPDLRTFYEGHRGRLLALRPPFPFQLFFSWKSGLTVRIGSRSSLFTEPLGRLDAVFKFLCTRKTYERVFKPARAEMVYSWQQAHIAGDVRRAWYIRNILAPSMLVCHALAQIPVSLWSLLGKLFQLSK